MDELIKMMSIEEIKKLKVTYQDNASIVAVLDGYIASKVLEVKVTKAVALRDKMAIGVANKILGALPEYTPEWRKESATQAISITTVEVDDEGKEQETVEENGCLEPRYPKMLVRQVSIGTAVTMVKAKGEPATRKRKVKDVYRLGSMPLELLLDGGENNYYTWGQIIADINENHRELLRVNGDGDPEAIIETTASGVQDLRTAGFLGIER